MEQVIPIEECAKQRLQVLVYAYSLWVKHLNGTHQKVNDYRLMRHCQTGKGDVNMPFVNIKILEGVFNTEQKQEMIQKVTDTMVSIEGENMRPVTWVVVEEVKSGDWGIAGKGYTTEDVMAIAEGK